MYSRILVAIDFSDASIDALDWASRHFADAKISLVHVLNPPELPSYIQQSMGEAIDVELDQAADAYANLEQVASTVGIEADLRVRTGWPPRQIREAANDTGAQLIVLGSPQQRMWSEEVGPTATRTPHRSGPPVYIWRPIPRRAHPEDRTVLAAVDLHDTSEGVAATAAAFAHHFGAQLVLCHVITRTLQSYLRAVTATPIVEEAQARILDAARTQALALVPEEQRRGLEMRAVVTRGRPWTQILAAAEAESANLIVMGVGRGPGAGRALLGSVTERVIRASNSSVLTVPVS